LTEEIHSYVQFEIILSHIGFDTFLDKFMTLNRLGSQKEALESFWKHYRDMIEPVISHPYFSSPAFLTALRNGQPLPASAQLTALRRLCKDYLLILREVGNAIERYPRNPPLPSLDLYSFPIRDLSRVSELAFVECINLSGAPLVTDIEPLGRLPSLRDLVLYTQPTQNIDLTPLQNLASLRRLSLRGQGVREIRPLANLTALDDLSLAECDNFDCSPLGGLPFLTRLELLRTAVTDLTPLREMNLLESSTSPR
jgi:Leucine-rich repeat (LRR) protein